MKRLAAVMTALATLTALTTVEGHGASKGMHVHAHPDPVSPGSFVRFHADADRPLPRVVWSCGSGTPRVARPGGRPADGRLEWGWRVPPESPAGVVACRFELDVPDGARRASLVLRIDAAQPSPVGQATPVPPRPQ